MTDETRPTGAHYDQSIVITGGTVTGALATGKAARASFHQTVPAVTADLDGQIAELSELLERHRATIDDAEQVLRDTADLLAAAAAREPDRDRVRAILERIAARGTALVAVVEVVEKTRELVSRIL
jgi:delta 1-pyrroline-5-carboxylate dehydrogenase